MPMSDQGPPKESAAASGAGSVKQPPEIVAILTDQQSRWERGDCVRVDDLIRQHPNLNVDADGVLELIFHEAILREQRGDQPKVEEYLQIFPHLAEQLQRQFAIDDIVRAGDASMLSTCAHDPRAGGQSEVVLEVIAGPLKGKCFQFDSHDTLLVGRAGDATLQLLDDPHFSRHHFLLEFNPPNCLLRDLGSSNGTLVNGRKVTTCLLQDGDVIAAGRTQMRFARTGAVEPPTLSMAASSPAMPLSEAPTRSRPVQNAHEAQALAIAELALPGYEVVRSLGRGGMGEVFQARQLANGQLCAVKVILPEANAGERAKQRFLREVSVLSQLVHPGIVKFREVGLHQGKFFFAMEYVETVNLEQLLQRLLPPNRVQLLCGLLCQVLEALSYAHGRGFVHRDIKPANLLVSECAGGSQTGHYSAKLADFGLAKNFENAGLSGMTFSGEVLGTLSFMAPEQILQARRARPSVDIYAIGATLYYCLAKSPLYDFSKSKDRLAIILEDLPVPLGKVCPSVPAALEAVISRTLLKDPKQRFPSANDLRQALLPFAGAGSEPVVNHQERSCRR